MENKEHVELVCRNVEGKLKSSPKIIKKWKIMREVDEKTMP